MNLIHLFTAFDGRIPRMTWWLGLIILIIPSTVIVETAQALGNQYLGTQATGPNVVWAMAALLLTWPEVALTTKRFNDRGHALWVAEVYLAVSILTVGLRYFGVLGDPREAAGGELLVWGVLATYSLWVLVDNGFLPGTKGPNAYGDDPRDE